MIGLLAGKAIEAVSGFVTKRQDMKAARQAAGFNEMASSWKDEAWTLWVICMFTLTFISGAGWLGPEVAAQVDQGIDAVNRLAGMDGFIGYVGIASVTASFATTGMRIHKRGRLAERQQAQQERNPANLSG